MKTRKAGESKKGGEDHAKRDHAKPGDHAKPEDHHHLERITKWRSLPSGDPHHPEILTIW